MKTLGVSFLIGAKLGATYEATLGTAERKVKQFDQSIRELEHGRGDIERFRALKRGAREAEVQLGQTQAEIRQLAREMRQAGPAVAELGRDLEAARKPQAQLKESTEQTARELGQANLEVRQLSQQMRRGAEITDELRQRFEAASQRAAELKSKLAGQKAALGQANEEVRRLGQEMRESSQASDTLARRFEAAKKRAATLKGQVAEQRGELHRLRGQLQGAGADTGRLEGRYRQLGATLDQVKAKQERMGRINAEQERLRGKRGEYRSQVMEVVALGAALAAPVTAAMDFEDAMADIKKVVDFKEPDGLAKLGSTLKGLSRRIPLKPSELAKIAAAGGQFGIAEEHLAGFTEMTAKMGTAWDMTPEKVGKSVAKLSNVLGIPVQDMGKVGDALNHLSDNTAAEAPEMVDVLLRVGGAGKQFGLAAEQVAALGSTFLALGKTPETASTAMNALLNKLSTADKQGKAFKGSLKQLGWTAKELKAAIGKDAQGALNAFLESVAKMDESKRAGILTDLFGAEYQDDIATLVGALEQYNKAQGLVAKEASYLGSVQREFDSRSSTSWNKLKLLGNVVISLGINLGTVLLPGINAIVGAMATGIGWIADFAEQHETLTMVVGGAIAGFIALRVATFALGWTWTIVKDGALSLVKGIEWLTGRQVLNRAATEASTTATRRMGMAQMWAAGKSKVLLGATRLLGLGLKSVLVGTGIGAVLVGLGLLIENWDTVSAAIVSGWQWLTDALGFDPLGWVVPAWEGISTFFGGFWTRLKDDAAEAWEWIASKIGVVGDALKKIPFINKLFGDEEEQAPEIGKSVKDLPVGRTVSVAQPSPDAIPVSPDAIPVSADAIPVSADAISAGGVTINYAPTFHITGTGDPAAVRGQVEQAMAMDRRELERMIRAELRKLRDEEKRLAYR